jgi:hypothetical protein
VIRVRHEPIQSSDAGRDNRVRRTGHTRLALVH